jgi:pimeloyl-ACP methyl ester carboxylesterase
VAIRSPWTTQAEFIKNARKVEPDQLLVPNESFNAANEPIRVAPQVKIPVWIAVGEIDPLTTPKMGQQIYEVLGGKRQYWQADGAGHTGAEMPENVQISLFTAQIHSFYRRYLGTAGF